MIIFVGDKPSSKMKHNAKPFEGASCESRLYEWVKAVLPQSYMTRWEYPAFKIINQSDHDVLAGYLMLVAADHYNNPHRHVIVALGNTASKAIGKHIPHYKLPHPSGRNRKLNNKSFVKKELYKCKTFIEKSLSHRPVHSTKIVGG